MTKRRHSYVAFYMDDWSGGTLRMTRLMKSVLFDVCFYNWDTVQPMPPAEQRMAFADLEGQGEQIVDLLVTAGKLTRNADGSVFKQKAIDEGARAFALWDAKSRGGKRARGVPQQSSEECSEDSLEQSSEESSREHEPEPEPEEKEGGKPPSQKGGVGSMGVFGAWNRMAKAHGLTVAVKMTEERRKKINARIAECGESMIMEAIDLVPSRPFLCGENERKWKADIDWFVRPNSIAKVLEGGAYQGDGGGKASGWR